MFVLGFIRVNEYFRADYLYIQFGGDDGENWAGNYGIAIDNIHAYFTGGADSGKDILTGGLGSDTFVWTNDSYSGVTHVTRDVITDFNHGSGTYDAHEGDLIDLGGLLAPNATVIGHSDSFQNAYNQMRWYQSGSDTIIEIDYGGDNIADRSILLQNFFAENLSLSDFVLGSNAQSYSGTSGNDTQTGSSTLVNIMEGGGGDDTLTGGRNADFISGGDGDDLIFGAAGADELYGGSGNDALYAGSRSISFDYSYNLAANGSSESGSMASWTKSSGSGTFISSNSLARTGNYSFLGNHSSATYYQSVDLLGLGFSQAQISQPMGFNFSAYYQGTGSNLSDTVSFRMSTGVNATTMLVPKTTPTYVANGSWQNVSFSYTDADYNGLRDSRYILFSFTGDDAENSGTQGVAIDDIYVTVALTQELGHDVLTGGSGSDQFVWSNQSYSYATFSGREVTNGSQLDRITDFSGVVGTERDQVVMEGIGIGWSYGGSTFTGSAKQWISFQGTGSSSAHTYLLFDINADMQADFVIQLSNFNHADFNIIEDIAFVSRTGTQANDTLTAAATGEGLHGLAGDDVLNGGVGHDWLYGGAGNDVLNGGDGDDFLDGGVGADILIGGDGDDRIIYDEEDLVQANAIQGGAGMDTYILAGANQHLDLTMIDDSYIIDIENIDLTGTGDNTLSLNETDLKALSSTTDELYVDGNAGDTVNLYGNWIIGAVSGGYQNYSLSGANIYIDTDITIHLL